MVNLRHNLVDRIMGIPYGENFKEQILDCFDGVTTQEIKQVLGLLEDKYRSSSLPDEVRKLQILLSYIGVFIVNECGGDITKARKFTGFVVNNNSVTSGKELANKKSRLFDRKKWCSGKTDFEKEGIIFPKSEALNLGYNDILKKYKQEHINNLSKESYEVVNSVNKQILTTNGRSRLSNKNIVAIPVYGKENFDSLKGLVDELRQQDGDFKVVLFVNSYDADFDDDGKQISFEEVSKVDHDKLVKSLKSYCESDNRFIVTDNYYVKRAPMGTIRADMSDGIIQSLSDGVDGNLIFVDADTWKIEKGYIESVQKSLDDPSKSYCVGTLRRTLSEAKKYKFVWFAELLSSLLIQFNQRSHRIHSSGASTSYKFTEYMKVRGMERSLWSGEDVTMGYKFEQLYGENSNRGVFMNRSDSHQIWTDPRRGEKALLEGKDFHQQWGGVFEHVDKKSLNRESLDEMNKIIFEMLSNKDVSDQDLNKIESYIDNFCNRHGKDSPYWLQMYIKNGLKIYWNHNCSENSLYRIDLDSNRKLKFIKKTSIKPVGIKFVETLLSDDGWKKIGSGLQFTAFSKGDRVLKFPNGEEEIKKFIISQGIGDGMEYVDIISERDRSISYIRKYLDGENGDRISDDGGDEFLGNPVIRDDMSIEQDKCEILANVINDMNKSGDYVAMERLFYKYIRNIFRSWRRGFCDRSFNFTINNGLNSRGNMVLLDFGELVFDEDVVKDFINRKQWEQMYSYKSLSDEAKRVFKGVMDQNITLDNFNKYRKR